jgi:hypothetical protein
MEICHLPRPITVYVTAPFFSAKIKPFPCKIFLYLYKVPRATLWAMERQEKLQMPTRGKIMRRIMSGQGFNFRDSEVERWKRKLDAVIAEIYANLSALGDRVKKLEDKIDELERESKS